MAQTKVPAKSKAKAGSKSKSRLLPDGDMSGLKKVLKKYAGDKGALIPILQAAQEVYGYLSERVLEEIARSCGVPLAAVYGVATFYTQFRLRPHGRTTVKVCRGTACYVSGAQQISEAVCGELEIPEGGMTEDRKFTLESVACLGCCGLAPVMMIGDKAYGRLTPEEARSAIKKATGT